jgi:hypothetical protein
MSIRINKAIDRNGNKVYPGDMVRFEGMFTNYHIVDIYMGYVMIGFGVGEVVSNLCTIYARSLENFGRSGNILYKKGKTNKDKLKKLREIINKEERFKALLKSKAKINHREGTIASDWKNLDFF